MTTSVVKAHAELGASSADRWMNCTGSVDMVRDIPNVSTEYSREGTAAHTVLEKCLKLNVDASVFVDTEVDGIPVTDDMAEAVQVALDEVRRIVASEPDTELSIERRFSLDQLNPPAPMFGTSDVVIFLPRSKRLVVLDYKHGVGYAVAARNNAQLRYYALGAVLAGGWTAAQVAEVEVVIVQPRAVHPDGIIRRDRMTFEELHDFTGELLAKADEATSGRGKLKTGPWCRFCRASSVCPERLKEAQALAQVEFAQAAVAPPAPDKLSMDELLVVLEKAPMIEAWLKDVRTFVENSMIAGSEVPGWKLVQKRATRRWADENATRAFLDERGFMPEEYEERKLKSPAQVEKLFGKKKDALPDDLVVKESSGYTLAPEYDKRPAVTPGSEFAALPTASSTSTGNND